MRSREIRREGSGGVLSATGQYMRVRRSFTGISRAATEDTVSPQARQDAFICILSGDLLFLLWRADQIMLVFSRKFQTGLFPISVCSCPRPFCLQPLMRGTLVFATDFVVDRITFITVPGGQFPSSELRVLWGTVEGGTLIHTGM